MMIKRILLFCFVIIGCSVSAQKVHFTQFGFAPLTVNPALTGSFSGTVRLTGAFRDQYFGSSDFTPVGTFVNLGLGVEWNALRGFREYDWIAVGLNLGNHTESSGAVGVNTISGNDPIRTAIANNVFNISLAYHLGMGKKGANVLSIGAQYGQFGRTFGIDD